MDHHHRLASIANIQVWQVQTVLQLSDEGATIPFIARYRKEKTGHLDEVKLQMVITENRRLLDLYERKKFILEAIAEQNKLSHDLEQKIQECFDSKVLEDLYAPFKKKKKSRGDIAIDAGLEPLAKLIFGQRISNLHQTAGKYVCKVFPSVDYVLQGAQDIIAEWINENVKTRDLLLKTMEKTGFLSANVVKSKKEDATKYADYFNFQELLKKCPSHRVLAMLRGANEGFLKVHIEMDNDQFINGILKYYIRTDGEAAEIVEKAIRDAYKRLMFPSIENSVLQEAKNKADKIAIDVFSKNLKQLLLAAPVGTKRILGVDPGFRTGCKLAFLDENGNVMHTDTLYILGNDNQNARYKIEHLLKEYDIQAIAIGNGTASRETETFFRNLKIESTVDIYIVSESGASIYSASDVAREEFPSLDLTLRGAISIGRRLMDPLSELVKIDPKSIGVGQYQHDVHQPTLKESLDFTVQSCVNKVGININTASHHLLQYISGLGPTLAKNIVEFRRNNGPYKQKSDLMQVSRLGQKAFEQCAGFLRIREGENPLDNTGIHPETYPIVESMVRDSGCTMEEFIRQKKFKNINELDKYTDKNFGLATLNDILLELDKPGLDPRGENKVFKFIENVKTIEDVKVGMTLPGIVTNVTAFGAFVDIGIKQEGLIHISQLSEDFVSNPMDIVQVQQQVTTEVLQVDIDRKRVQLKLLKGQ